MFSPASVPQQQASLTDVAPDLPGVYGRPPGGRCGRLPVGPVPGPLLQQVPHADPVRDLLPGGRPGQPVLPRAALRPPRSDAEGGGEPGPFGLKDLFCRTDLVPAPDLCQPGCGGADPGSGQNLRRLLGSTGRGAGGGPRTVMKSLAHPVRYWSAGRYWPGTEARSEPPGLLATSIWTHSGLMSSSIAVRAPA